MPFVKIEQDCRVLGQGFSPGEKPVEVDEVVAAALVKEKLGVVVDAPEEGDPGSGGGGSEHTDTEVDQEPTQDQKEPETK